jgi:hypothetical protein
MLLRILLIATIFTFIDTSGEQYSAAAAAALLQDQDWWAL